jgi:hypothetical protein
MRNASSGLVALLIFMIWAVGLIVMCRIEDWDIDTQIFSFGVLVTEFFMHIA